MILLSYSKLRKIKAWIYQNLYKIILSKYLYKVYWKNNLIINQFFISNMSISNVFLADCKSKSKIYYK